MKKILLMLFAISAVGYAISEEKTVDVEVKALLRNEGTVFKIFETDEEQTTKKSIDVLEFDHGEMQADNDTVTNSIAETKYIGLGMFYDINEEPVDVITNNVSIEINSQPTDINGILTSEIVNVPSDREDGIFEIRSKLGVVVGKTVAEGDYLLTGGKITITYNKSK